MRFNLYFATAAFARRASAARNELSADRRIIPKSAREKSFGGYRPACWSEVHRIYRFFVLLIAVFVCIVPAKMFAQGSAQSMNFPFDKALYESYRAAKEEKEKQTRLAATLDILKPLFKVRYHTLTAYSSTPEQTDNSPFITAAGTFVHDGIVAANSLPFGTKILIPDIFGDKIFTVEDRMAPQNYHKIDIWFPSTDKAMEFGVKHAKILILGPQAINLLENAQS